MTSQKRWASQLTFYYLLFAVFFYSYIYFFNFDQGRSEVPLAFPILRDGLFLCLVGFTYFTFPERFNLKKIPLVFLSFVLYIFLTSLSNPSFLVLKETKNLLLYAMAFFLAGSMMDSKYRPFILLFLLGQLLFSYYGQLIDVGWENRKICGTLGNPNILAMLLVLLIFFITLQKKLNWLHYFIFSISFFLLLYTRSSAGLLIFLAALFCTSIYFYRRKEFRALFIFLGLTILITFLAEYYTEIIHKAFWILFYNKIVSTLGMPDLALSAEDYAEIVEVSFRKANYWIHASSASISGRTEQIALSVEHLKQFPHLQFWFGSFKNYFVGDIQYAFLLIHHGFIGLILFLSLLVEMLRRSILARNFLLFLLTSIFCAGFLFYRILYYFPLNMIFFALCYYTLVQLPKNTSEPKNI